MNYRRKVLYRYIAQDLDRDLFWILPFWCTFLVDGQLLWQKKVPAWVYSDSLVSNRLLPLSEPHIAQQVVQFHRVRPQLDQKIPDATVPLVFCSSNEIRLYRFASKSQLQYNLYSVHSKAVFCLHQRSSRSRLYGECHFNPWKIALFLLQSVSIIDPSVYFNFSSDTRHYHLPSMHENFRAVAVEYGDNAWAKLVNNYVSNQKSNEDINTNSTCQPKNAENLTANLLEHRPQTENFLASVLLTVWNP